MGRKTIVDTLRTAYASDISMSIMFNAYPKTFSVVVLFLMVLIATWGEDYSHDLHHSWGRW